jgi:rhodanese-related sulfurtransferase
MIKEISAFELKNMMESGEAPNILDVRETHEFREGHIPGALNIPVGLIPVKTDEIDKNKPWYVICLSGGRSAAAVQYLSAMGWDATNVAGGMSLWTGEIETGMPAYREKPLGGGDPERT